MGLRNGPIVKRRPVETNTMAANARVTHQPKNTREVGINVLASL